ncbi:N-acetylneuraminate synthase family protein [Chromobacterium sphagni]|nr:N-acetylneuraminate synthase family protein [Chromobacterium sphagni]
MKSFHIESTLIADAEPSYIIAEIGINHNGSLEHALRLIDTAHEAGCNAVKFQKRTLDVVYSAEEMARPRDSLFGHTNGDLKRGLEFGINEYRRIDEYCRELGIHWFASCWDEDSVDFIEQFNPVAYKIASASLTDDGLLRHTRATGKPIILSTGMSTLEQIDHAVEVLGTDKLAIMHCCAAYPSKYEDLNLRVIPTLRARYGVPTGYSGHETGLASSVAAVALGACLLERHITTDRALWGSDQSASLEPSGLNRLVRDVRLVESALGSDQKRLLDCEVPVQQKLRRK